MWQVKLADFSDPQVLALLRVHLEAMQEHSPPESVHALDTSGLQKNDIRFYCVWEEGVLLGFGALRLLGASVGELKSMRTHPSHTRRGVARYLLEHILKAAAHEGCTRLSLETGSGPAFEPALALYRAYGFQHGAAFGGYTATDFNQFMHRNL